MTACAVGSKRLSMDIIALMTRHALGVGVAEMSCSVACLTGDSSVESQQRKAREVVIELHVPLPSNRAVTAATILSLTPRMGVIGAVAGNARHLELLSARIRTVAALARQTLVFTRQGKLRVAIVIKRDSRPAASRVAARTIGAVPAPMNIV